MIVLRDFWQNKKKIKICYFKAVLTLAVTYSYSRKIPVKCKSLGIVTITLNLKIPVKCKSLGIVTITLNLKISMSKTYLGAEFFASAWIKHVFLHIAQLLTYNKVSFASNNIS